MENHLSCCDAEQELKNRVTAIKAAAEILQENMDLHDEERSLFFQIIFDELDDIVEKPEKFCSKNIINYGSAQSYFLFGRNIIYCWLHLQRIFMSGTLNVPTRSSEHVQ